MRIIDTFLFSEPYEKEVLLIKFILGNPYVMRWILVENSYTFQGEFKGLFAKDVIYSDQRFENYRHKIKIISGNIKFPPFDYNAKNDEQGLIAERKQRQLAWNYINSNFSNSDWVFISDTDECLDFDSDRFNYQFLHNKIEKSKDGIIAIPRTRFWYDFDNIWSAKRCSPLVSMKKLRTSDIDLGIYRKITIGNSIKWKRKILFEYSFCGSKEDIIRKYESFAHSGVSTKEIMQGIKCNHLPQSSIRGRKLTLKKENWLEFVSLMPGNSPHYIRENLELLKTNTVDNNYKLNRLLDYPELFSFRGRVSYLVRFGYQKVINFFFRFLKWFQKRWNSFSLNLLRLIS